MLEKRNSRRELYKSFKAELVGLDIDEYLGTNKSPHEVHRPVRYHVVETLCAFMMHRFLNLMLDEIIECLEEMPQSSGKERE
jgi:hypothetical protein